MLTTAKLITAAAFQRNESRGAHFRSDHPLAEMRLAEAKLPHARKGRSHRTRKRPRRPRRRAGFAQSSPCSASRMSAKSPFPLALRPGLVERAVSAALEEDLGAAGDITTEAIIAADATARPRSSRGKTA